MESPKPIRHKTRALLNIKNEDDNRCLEWALVAAIEDQLKFPKHEYRTRAAHYQKSSVKMDMTGISFPYTQISEVRIVISTISYFKLSIIASASLCSLIL